MDEAAKDQPQVRGVKKRGRPPKVRDMSEAQMESAVQEFVAEDVRLKAQSLASRIWDGQSPDLSRAERLERVKRGLEAQGLSMEGVTL